MKRIFFRKRSFRRRLVAAFCVISIMPMILALMVSYYNVIGILQKNSDTLENANLAQTSKIIKINLDFYKDLLYQVYRDDGIIEIIDAINAGENVELHTSTLRHALHGYIYTMPYVQSIAVVTSGGFVVFDDLLTGFNTKSSWLDLSGDQAARLFGSIAASNETTIIPSQPASFYPFKEHFLFHIAHRVVDYNDIWKKNAVVILSIDELMLDALCDERFGGKLAGEAGNQVFIIAEDGTVISFPDKSKVGTKLDFPTDAAGKKEAMARLVLGSGSPQGKKLSIYEMREPETNWNIVVARDQSAIYDDISNQQRITIAVVSISVIALLVIIYWITGRLTWSINLVGAAMNRAGRGELSVRIEKDARMPLEIDAIADNFNHMIGEIGWLVEEVQTASEKQKNAEIAALEAQVNPHFLYNALDTINWMAIDREEFEISKAINSLAMILRYSIDDSNGIVAVRQEAEWLKQYFILQQIRLKNEFECVLDIDPAALDCRVHKLLFQPFVENSIIHGFKGLERNLTLNVSITRDRNELRAVIADNGRGIDERTVMEINGDGDPQDLLKAHIGMRNAIERIKMYYGSAASVSVESVYGEGTRVVIVFPVL